MFDIKNLVLRTISALIILPLVILLVLEGGIFFNLFLYIISLLMAFEWSSISSNKKQDVNMAIINVIGLFVISLPIVSILILRNISENEINFGLDFTFQLIIIVCATDIGGYVFGKTLKGPKLMPSVSPNKTWYGALGGIIFSIVAISIYKYSFDHFFNGFILVIITSIISQLSDLLESKYKRIFAVKDSGNIIPGHGGILDRVDGFILAAPAYLMFKVFFPGL